MPRVGLCLTAGGRYIGGYAKNYSISIANPLDIWQSCSDLSISPLDKVVSESWTSCNYHRP